MLDKLKRLWKENRKWAFAIMGAYAVKGLITTSLIWVPMLIWWWKS